MTLQRERPPPIPHGVEIPEGKHPRGSTTHATLWTLGGEAASHLIRLVSSLFLTRLLFPSDFGIMAVVNLFMHGLNMFSDLGIRTIIIRHERGDDPDFLNTMWTVRLVRGAILGLAACAVAWPLSRFYGLPILAYLIPAAALNLVLEGFQSSKVYTTHRHLQLARPTIISLASSLVTVLLMIAGAWAFKSVWILVWGAVAGTLFRVILSHAALPGPRDRFHWDRKAWHEVAHFGKWVFVSSVATFFAEQMDRLLFAKLMPIEILGVYAIAIAIAKLPTEAVLRLASSIVLPSLSRVRHLPAEMNAIFNKLRLRILLGGGLGISFLILCGPSLIRMLYDARYAEAGWILQASCIGGWFVILGASHSPALLVQGHPKWQALGSAVKAAVMTLVVPYAFVLFKFAGAIVAFGMAESVRYLFESAKVRKSGLKDWGAEAAITALMLGFGIAAAAIRHGPLGGDAAWVRAVLSFAVFLAVWSVVAAWVLRKNRRLV